MTRRFSAVAELQIIFIIAMWTAVGQFEYTLLLAQLTSLAFHVIQ